MLFHYTAKDGAGASREGMIEAFTIESAITSLEQRGYTVGSIDPVAEKPSLFDQRFSFFEHVSNKEIVIFSRQIATLFEAQVSSLRVFRLLGAETENALLQRTLNEVGDAMQGGSSIANALSRHPEIFSPFYISMVRAGEESGRLDKTFTFLAEYLDRTYEVMSKARNALIYPAFVVVTFIAVMVLMMTMVIPRLSDIILESGQSVPIYTSVIIAISLFLTKYIGLILLFLSVGAVALWHFARTEVGRRATDELKLAVPYIGDLFQKLYLSRIADSLSTMLASGISVLPALETASEVVDNRVYREIVLDAISKVKGGRTVSDAFSDYPEMPGVMVQMIKVGEESGNIGSILETLAKFYRREVDGAVDTLVSLIEPAMIVLLGAGVAILLAAVLIPIYNISTSV